MKLQTLFNTTHAPTQYKRSINNNLNELLSYYPLDFCHALFSVDNLNKAFAEPEQYELEMQQLLSSVIITNIKDHSVHDLLTLGKKVEENIIAKHLEIEKHIIELEHKHSRLKEDSGAMTESLQICEEIITTKTEQLKHDNEKLKNLVFDSNQARENIEKLKTKLSPLVNLQAQAINTNTIFSRFGDDELKVFLGEINSEILQISRQISLHESIIERLELEITEVKKSAEHTTDELSAAIEAKTHQEKQLKIASDNIKNLENQISALKGHNQTIDKHVENGEHLKLCELILTHHRNKKANELKDGATGINKTNTVSDIEYYEKLAEHDSAKPMVAAIKNLSELYRLMIDTNKKMKPKDVKEIEHEILVAFSQLMNLSLKLLCMMTGKSDIGADDLMPFATALIKEAQLNELLSNRLLELTDVIDFNQLGAGNVAYFLTTFFLAVSVAHDEINRSSASP